MQENCSPPSVSSSSTPATDSHPVCRSVHLFSSLYSPSSLTPSLFVTPSASVFVSKVTALIIDAVWLCLCLLTVKGKKKRKSQLLILTAVTRHVWLSYSTNCFHSFMDLMYDALVMGPWSFDQAQQQSIQIHVVFFLLHNQLQPLIILPSNSSSSRNTFE